MSKADETRQAIKVALAQLLGEHDLTSITTGDLAKQAGISRSTLYRYYDSINDLVKEMEGDFIERARDLNRYTIGSPITRDNIDESIESYAGLFRYYRENADFYLGITGPHGDPQFLYKLHKLMREFYGGKLVYDGINGPHMDMDMVFIFGGHDALVEHWLRNRPDISPEDFSSHLQRLMFGMFML